MSTLKTFVLGIEFENLKKLYFDNKYKIKDIYDIALFGSDDKIFDISAQKDFFKERLKIIQNARHSISFRINNYEQILSLNI